MIELLLAVTLYVVVFGIDYLFYVKQGNLYSYVSRRTHLLFTLGQLATIGLFYTQFKTFFVEWPFELLVISLFGLGVLLFALQLTHDKVYVCSMSSRTLRCLTPYYVLVKGSEIIFQQLIYLVVALYLVQILGIHFLTYIVYIVILLIMHTVVILGGGQSVVKSLTFGLFAIAAPIFYVFTAFQLFWPAVAIHSLMYVFYWLIVADFDEENGINLNKTQNSG